jgi:hypothetical protein
MDRCLYLFEKTIQTCPHGPNNVCFVLKMGSVRPIMSVKGKDA